MKAVPINRLIVFVLIAVAGCAADLASKNWIFHRLGMPGGDVWWFWEPYFGLQTSCNAGALFGMGQGKVWIFAAASCIALLGISSWLFIFGAARDWLLNISLAVVMGGVLGNLYDRLGLWAVPDAPQLRLHAVRDWILFQCPPWVWPNFNIADSLLVCGGMMLVWQALTTHAAPIKEQSAPEAARPHG